jgi:hypothetical protein
MKKTTCIENVFFEKIICIDKLLSLKNLFALKKNFHENKLLALKK